MGRNIITVKEQDGDIVIRCSVSDLVFAAQQTPEFKFHIPDSQAFADDFVKELDAMYNPHSREGLRLIEELFEKAIMSVYESGSDSIINESEKLKY